MNKIYSLKGYTHILLYENIELKKEIEEIRELIFSYYDKSACCIVENRNGNMICSYSLYVLLKTPDQQNDIIAMMLGNSTPIGGKLDAGNRMILEHIGQWQTEKNENE